jgi:ribonuclease HII
MGDSRCYSVACASILSKVTRDHLMDRLARRYPRYGWERNAGYATEEHVVALDYVGGTPHHRTTFRIRQLTLGLDEGDADAQAMPSGFLGDDDLEGTLADLEGLESAPGDVSDVQASL